jgi:hypothetical protein
MHHLHGHTIMWKGKIPIIPTMSILFPNHIILMNQCRTFQGH